MSSESDVKFDIHALRENCPSVRMVTKEISAMLLEIKSKIFEAHKNKERSIQYVLKSNYDIPNTSNKDAQTEIWGRLIRTLEDEWHLDVKLKHLKDKDRYTMIINWISPADEEKKKLYTQSIKSALNK